MVPLLDELVLFALVIIVFAGGLLYILNRRLKARIAKLREAVGDGTVHVDDRSYNLLALARSELAALRRDGVDVHVAAAAIADAERAMARRDFDDAARSARRAHELLVAQRAGMAPSPPPSTPSRSMPTSSPSRTPDPRPNAPADAPLAPVPTDAAGEAPPAPRLAKNRAESRFQMSLLGEEVTAAARDHPDATGLAEARKGAANAQAAYDRTEYTESLRLALRARRALGTRIEALPAPLTRIPPTLASVPPGTASGPAGTEPCVSCGRPLQASDKFCRSCGTAKAPTACAACGTPLEGGDRFCAGCGAPVGDGPVR
ncbi:MAG: zinc ribbon domain-containing protein [Thermoplasmata archaeon]|nr:zinc ribbon domain-containing protein [Thermoplasmata archaeon]